MIKSKQISRRRLLVWSTPVVVSITLPRHAVATHIGGVCSAGAPVVSVLDAPKCSGNPPVGVGAIQISGVDSTPITIKNITQVSDDPKSDIGDFPSFPIDVTDISPFVIIWTGPASDGITCLPLATITITIEYCCDDGEVFSETYDITELLVGSVP